MRPSFGNTLTAMPDNFGPQRVQIPWPLCVTLSARLHSGVRPSSRKFDRRRERSGTGLNCSRPVLSRLTHHSRKWRTTTPSCSRCYSRVWSIGSLTLESHYLRLCVCWLDEILGSFLIGSMERPLTNEAPVATRTKYERPSVQRVNKTAVWWRKETKSFPLLFWYASVHQQHSVHVCGYQDQHSLR